MLVLGIVLFALGIMVSIVLHEYGHMRVAQATGMKVRRFFVGFGPTVWSTHRGGIEYGLKAVPLGGFCDIAGMTAYDRLDPEDEPKAMWRQAGWKRVAVLLAGPVMNIVLAILLFYVVAVGWGLANRDVQSVPAGEVAALVGETCEPGPVASGAEPVCGEGVGPAGAAGLRAGDRITEIDGRAVWSWPEVAPLVTDRAGETVTVTVDRAGSPVTARVHLATIPQEGRPDRGALGVSLAEEAVPAKYRDDPAYQPVHTYDAVSAIPATFVFTGDMIRLTLEGLASFPSKIPGVVASIFVNHVYYWGDRHRDRFLGPGRGERISPVASVVAAGLAYALHCDCPVTPVNPLFTMNTAVHRVTREGHVLGAEQRVSASEALAGYTSAAARLTGESSDKGRIAVGLLADFVVLDGDPLRSESTDLNELSVLRTVVGGETVFEV